MRAFLRNLKNWAERLETEVTALYYAYRDPRTPWYARIFSAMVFTYAISPIDIIPDFIPVLGYLDDALIVPLGIWIALKLIPTEVIADARVKSTAVKGEQLVNRRRSILLASGIWLFVIGMIAFIIYRVIKK